MRLICLQKHNLTQKAWRSSSLFLSRTQVNLTQKGGRSLPLFLSRTQVNIELRHSDSGLYRAFVVAAHEVRSYFVVSVITP